MRSTTMNSLFQDMLSYFNMNSDPFARDIEPARLLKLPSIEESLASLGFFCERRGIGLLIGKSGSGKSCLLRLLVSGLPVGLYQPVYLCHSTVSLPEFYGHLAAAFTLQSQGRRSTLFRAVKDHVYQLHRSQRIHPVLIIDEAHCLSNDILVELRQLLNFQYDSETCMSILLCGQEDLLARLRLSLLEPLANSVTTTVTMKPLTLDETTSYLEERLRQVGARTDLFSQPAVRAIHNASHGVMRSINAIASGGILKAWRVKAQVVESDFITAMTG
jgi:type II secretory pathway predicted ATPase ExeA